MITARPAVSSKASLELYPDCVVKTQPPVVAALELERSRLGAAVADRSLRFHVPAVIEHDLARGRLVFERVPDLVPLRNAMAESAWPELCTRAALTLAEIHTGLALPPHLQRRVRAELDGPGPAVALHGDFSPANVQVQRKTGYLWILDWSAPTWLDQGATTGPASLDLATFVLPLFWQRPGDPATVPRPEDRAGLFLATYAAATGCDLRAAGAHMRHLQRLRLPYAASLVSPSGAAARLPMQARCWRFLRRLGRGPRLPAR